jgi:hypothetical protein
VNGVLNNGMLTPMIAIQARYIQKGGIRDMAMINTPFINMLNTMVCNLLAKPFHRAINAPPIIIPPEKVTSIAVRRHMSGP